MFVYCTQNEKRSEKRRRVLRAFISHLIALWVQRRRERNHDQKIKRPGALCLRLRTIHFYSEVQPCGSWMGQRPGDSLYSRPQRLADQKAEAGYLRTLAQTNPSERSYGRSHRWVDSGSAKRREWSYFSHSQDCEPPAISRFEAH